MSTIAESGKPIRFEAVPRDLPLPEASRFETIRERYGDLFLLIFDVGLFMVLWQVVQTGSKPIIDPRWIPAPSVIAQAFVENLMSGQLFKHAAFSFTNYGIGVAISILIGIPLGMFLGSTPTVRAILGTYVWAAYSTPIIAFQPVLIILFGFGMEAKVVLIAALSIFPILINTMTGVATVDQVLLKAGRLFGANRYQLFTKIVLPFTVPWIVAGVRLAAIRGLLAMLISELYGSTKGLGFMVIRAAETMDTPTSYSAIVVVVVFSVALQQVFTRIENRLSPWRQAS
jgi:NitT/TauT family transport system permease protein